MITSVTLSYFSNAGHPSLSHSYHRSQQEQDKKPETRNNYIQNEKSKIPKKPVLFNLNQPPASSRDNLRIEKEKKKMSNRSKPSWTAENVAYVLRCFDSGVLPVQILMEMRSHGYQTLPLETIEQCLRVNGRAVRRL